MREEETWSSASRNLALYTTYNFLTLYQYEYSTVKTGEIVGSKIFVLFPWND